MLVSVPVHPLSIKILTRHTPMPISINKYDTLFVVLSSQRSERISTVRGKILLPCVVTFDVHSRLARHISQHPTRIGFAILKYHKEMLHRHVVGVLTENPKASAWDAIKQYLDTYGITEDDYPLETAYKNWQRFGWNFSKKNRQKAGQFSRKTGVKSSDNLIPKKGEKKHAGRSGAQPVFSDLELDQLSEQIFFQVNTLFKDLPKRFAFWVQSYVYIYVGKHSCRSAARTLCTNRQTIYRSSLNILSRCKKSPLLDCIVKGIIEKAP